MAFRPARRPRSVFAPSLYATPAPYVEDEVTVGEPEWALPGTLTLPAGDGPFPAVGSSTDPVLTIATRRVGANKPFRDLALGLASRGIAVLRYDKRSKVHAARMAALRSPTVKDESVDDAVEALAWLRAQPGIDPRADLRARPQPRRDADSADRQPRSQARWPVAIVLAGARPLARGGDPRADPLSRNARTAPSPPTSRQRIDKAAKAGGQVKVLRRRTWPSAPRVSGAPASYWLDLRGYDPPSAAQRSKMPMLMLQGERDFQVTMADFARWRAL